MPESYVSSMEASEAVDSIRVDDMASNLHHIQGTGLGHVSSLPKDTCSPGQHTHPANRLHDKIFDAFELHPSTCQKERAASIAYRNLCVYAFGATTDYQKTFANYPLAYLSLFAGFFGRLHKSRIDILRSFDGLVSSHEMLLVLGRPGSGCTTLLKSLAGHTHGLHVDKSSSINYQGKT